jgi:hypothetical protein
MGGMREWNNQNQMGRNTRNKGINKRLLGPLLDICNPKWTTGWQVCAVSWCLLAVGRLRTRKKKLVHFMAEAAVYQQFIFGTDTRGTALSLPSCLLLLAIIM